MRGAKEEEKVISPMFPRLHVNDTEKGGPRAPPRNKMALYEQFSVPSQRLSSGSASLLPLPPNNASNLVPSMSSNQDGGYKRSVFPPFRNSPGAPSHLSEKLFSYSSGGVKSSTAMASQKRKSMNSTDDPSMNITQTLLLSAKCKSFQSVNFSNFKNFSWKKHGGENDFRVPNSHQSGAALNCSNSHHSKDHENQSCANLSLSIQFLSVPQKQKQKKTEESTEVPQTCRDPIERSTSIPSIKHKIYAPTSLSGNVKNTISSKRAHPSSNQEYSSSSVDPLKCLRASNVRLNLDLGTTQDKTALGDSLLQESAGDVSKEHASEKVRSESYLRLSLGDHNVSPNNLENVNKSQEDKKCGSLPVGDVERHDDVAETSMVDSISALDITPNAVVGVIGEKQFWKARKVIANQQRVFAVQVFELHRLIKVQKLIAGQPHLLLEDNLYLGNASLNVSPMKKLPFEHVVEQSVVIVQPKHHSQRLHPSTDIANENAVEKLPLPPVNNETREGLLTPQSKCGSHSGNVPPAQTITNTNPSPWFIPPPGNQWLVPVLSPSEGLVYKPYTGPCPPTAGFMAPVYGSCGPMSLSPVPGAGDFLNTAYGVPASHQQGIGILPATPPMGQTYFPPYHMPVVNSSVSGLAVEQLSPFTGSHSKDNQFSLGDNNFMFPRQSSYNMPSEMSQFISYCVGKFQASKESEVQGSTASSPSERPKGDPLPLFPIEPTAQASDQNAQSNGQRTRVIKVVPHNPTSATKSAARIFQFIQEERQHSD